MNKTDLNYIASILEGYEETIILRLIDRAQYKLNNNIYLTGKSGFTERDPESLFHIRLRYQEEMDTLFGRFMMPEERPFNTDLLPPRRKVTVPECPLVLSDYNLVNLTLNIKNSYLKWIPSLCPPGDDAQYGTCAELDVYAVQAISRRIHYGAMYVAESKYRSNPDSYQTLIDKKDTAGILKLLTRPEVEKRILRRLEKKVDSLQAAINHDVRVAINGNIVCSFYKNSIIPITKEGQILYLLNRG